jgi:hypothetical protein
MCESSFCTRFRVDTKGVLALMYIIFGVEAEVRGPAMGGWRSGRFWILCAVGFVS